MFAFSTDDHALFPSIPPVDSSIIRTQVDLQGWSIEALSPNTTQVTLLEQSDPKGWSNKSSIPQIMAMCESVSGTTQKDLFDTLLPAKPSLVLASSLSGLEDPHS